MGPAPGSEHRDDDAGRQADERPRSRPPRLGLLALASMLLVDVARERAEYLASLERRG